MIINTIFIYLFICLLATVISYYLESKDTTILILAVGYPFFIIYSLLRELFGTKLWKFKAYLIFGKDSEPKFWEQHKILGSNAFIGKLPKNKGLYIFRLLKPLSEEDKKKYIEYIEQSRVM